MRNQNLGDGLPPGTRLQELEIVRELGSGGFGITYLARDLALDRLVAVKEYLPRDWGARRADGRVGPRSSSSSKDYAWGLKRFLKEARILAGLNDRGIVRVYRIVEAHGTAYMVMEHVEGRSLRRELKQRGTLPEARVGPLLEGIARGLAVVHGAGLLHRDVTPSNVMLRREDGSPVLIDFGAARQHMGRQSRSLTAVLTPGYAPPEQYYAKGRQGPWTDVYALGAVAYEALSGRVPDEAPGRALADELPPVEEVAAGQVSGELAALVASALQVAPESRPQDMAEFMAALPGAGSPYARRRGSTSASTTGRSKRRRWGWVAGGLAAAAAVALLWMAVAERGGDDAPTAESPAAESERPAPVDADSLAREERDLALDRSEVRFVQRALLEAGFDPGSRNGLMTQRTRDALSRWQTSRGLEATGYLLVDAADELLEAGREAVRTDSLAALARAAEAERLAAERADSAERAEEASRAEAARLAAEYADSLAAAEADRRAAEEERQAAADAERQAEAAEADRRAELRRPGRRFRDCATCPEMVLVGPGPFQLGSPVSEEGRDDDEGPQALVTIADTFALGVHEVTFDEWYECVRDGGCSGYVPDDEGWGGRRRPVVNVSWEDAQRYVSWLSQRTGVAYRLPSEAEWEYAARAGTWTARHWGRSSSGQCTYANGADMAWASANPDDDQTTASCDDGHAFTAPVGTYSANAWGLHDMLGNAWEWTEDCWHGSYRGAPADGGVRPGGDCSRRVLRGGSWSNRPGVLRSASRNWLQPGGRFHDFGFRVARTMR